MNEIALIGKPNSGKSLLFNRLTGLQQKVANFPGVTVDIKEGLTEDGYKVIDFPGIYSLNPLTIDEKIATEKFLEHLKTSPHLVVLCILDITRLQKSLTIGLQVQKACAEAGKPCIFVVNMMDSVKKFGGSNLEGLANVVGSPLIGISSKTLEGLGSLKELVADAFLNPPKYIPLPHQQHSTKLLNARVREICDIYAVKPGFILKSQNRIDQFLLSGILGSIIFFLIMLFIFQSIFTWSTPLMDGVEALITALGSAVTVVLPQGTMRDFIEQALFGGIGSFLVFVPQIFILIFIIGILEDSGYMARATIICHKPLSLFGLTGKSFVPLLSGFACAIPAMMAARTIESPKKRWLTILATPLMSCSARLPVYALLISAFIPKKTLFAGFIGLQGLTFFAVYLFGIIVAMLVTAFMSRTVYKNEEDAPFILELPPYRIPHFKPLFLRAANGAKNFVTKAGLIIFSVTVVVWFLGYFPNGSGNLSSSWLAYLGRAITPIFEPLGLDWRFGVAILSSFLAREVFVGTLGTLFGIEGADENIIGLSDKLAATDFSVASAIALLVFYALALQCFSTLAVMKKETGSWKMPTLVLISYSGLAYLLSVAAYNLVKLF